MYGPAYISIVYQEIRTQIKIQLERKKLLLIFNFVLIIKPHMPSFMHLPSI